MKRKAYIAHTFSLRYYVRDKVVPTLIKMGIEPLNPFYKNDGTTVRLEVKLADDMEAKGIDPRQDKEWMQRVKRIKKKIVYNDIDMINECDMIIAFMNNWSGGTTCEIFYMGFVKEKPVFLVTTSYPDIYEHPWINLCCKKGKIVKSLNELVKALKEKYKCLKKN